MNVPATITGPAFEMRKEKKMESMIGKSLVRSTVSKTSRGSGVQRDKSDTIDDSCSLYIADDAIYEFRIGDENVSNSFTIEIFPCMQN